MSLYCSVHTPFLKGRKKNWRSLPSITSSDGVFILIQPPFFNYTPLCQVSTCTVGHHITKPRHATPSVTSRHANTRILCHISELPL